MAINAKYSWASNTEAIKNVMSDPDMIADLKREYSRLRSIEAKRIGRLKDSDFAKLESAKQKVAPTLKSFYTKTGKFNKSAFANEYAKMQRFLQSERSTVSGQTSIRNRTLNTLQERGYDITAENYADFIIMMEMLRSRGLDRIYDSARAINNFLKFRGNKPMSAKKFNEFFGSFGGDLDDVE